MTWENERRAICRAMLDAADNGTTHAVYVCWTAYNGFADADALLGLGSGRYMELPPDERELARERVTALGRDLKAAAARHGEPEPTEARLTRVQGRAEDDPRGPMGAAARRGRRGPAVGVVHGDGGCAEVVRTGPV